MMDDARRRRLQFWIIASVGGLWLLFLAFCCR
jgi:hypothetical protein